MGPADLKVRGIRRFHSEVVQSKCESSSLGAPCQHRLLLVTNGRMRAHVALMAGFGGSWVLLGMEEESCPGKLTCLGSCQLLYSLLIKAQRIKCCHQRILASLLQKWCSTTGSRAVASTPPMMGWQTPWGWNGKSRCGRRASGMGASRTGRGRTHGDVSKPVSDSQGRWANAYRIDGASSVVYSSSSFAWWTWTEIWVFLLEVIQM